ncbi:MAG: tRNA (adenine(22)-N(1))-methyltransferase [Bacillota bacterium]
MKLSPRLMTIVEQVKQGSYVADIGTDHGYIPVFLIEKAIANKVVASDVNEGPLKRAVHTIQQHHLGHCIECRLGSGLEPIKPGEVDTVIIAGMGGLLIRDILNNNLTLTKSFDTFILQPMVAQDELRRWLIGNGYKIINEKLCREEHRIYEIIVVEKGQQSIEDDIYFEIGTKLIENRDPLLEEFLKKHIKKYEDIIDSIERQGSIMANEKMEMCIRKIGKLKEVLRWLSNVQK